MNLFGAFLLSLAIAFVQVAGATKQLAPSWKRTVCEKALIAGGLWNPPVLAQIHSPPDYSVGARGGTVRVKSSSTEFTTYNRTDRDQGELLRQKLYPYDLIRLDTLKGKTVLDMACGGGLFVEQMRRNGVNMMGLDVYLTKYQKSKPYFIQAGAADTGFSDASFDVIFITQGPATYEEGEPGLKYLLEARRLLKPGGRLLVSPLMSVSFSIDLEDLRPEVYLRGTPYGNLPAGLRATRWPDQWWMLFPAEEREGKIGHYWLEIVKD